MELTFKPLLEFLLCLLRHVLPNFLAALYDGQIMPGKMKAALSSMETAYSFSILLSSDLNLWSFNKIGNLAPKGGLIIKAH